jgi:hypothetical protein
MADRSSMDYKEAAIEQWTLILRIEYRRRRARFA